MLNQETAKAARTDSGYILRAPRRMLVADAVAQYMRVAFINPANGNTTPALVTQGGQTFINEALIKFLIAPTITSGGNPPAFSLTPDGKLTAKNADISGSVNANAGTLNNVTINENCLI
ncbi:hypothetical protein ACBQ92_01875, partial [Escherichia fergusonii]